jgi:L-fucose isomerase-like protein
MDEGPVTVFKVAGDLSRHFVAEGTLLRCEARRDLCRTQFAIQMDNPSQTTYFLTNPIGNHHIVIPGHHKDAIEALLS